MHTTGVASDWYKCHWVSKARVPMLLRGGYKDFTGDVAQG